MLRYNLSVIRFVRTCFKLGIILVPHLFLLAQAVSAGNRPGDRDNPSIQPPTFSNPNKDDDAAKQRTIRNSSPPMLSHSDDSSRRDRGANSGVNSSGQSFTPPSRANSNPPPVSNPSTGVYRNQTDSNRNFRNGNLGGGTINSVPRQDATTSNKMSSTPSGISDRATNAYRDKSSGRKYSIADAPPPAIGKPNFGANANNDFNRRVQREDSKLDDARKRLGDRKNDASGNQPNGKTIDRIGNKTVDKPVDQGGQINRGQQNLGVKNPDTPRLPKDKRIDRADANKPDGRGNPSADNKFDKKIDNKDAFNPNRFTRGGTAKDIPLVPKDSKIDVLPKGPLPDHKIDPEKHLAPKVLPGGHLPPSVIHEGDPKILRENMNHKRFDERVKAGELDAITKGELASKLKLADQYKYMRQGDVARRLDLQKHTADFIHATAINNITVQNLKGIPPRPGFCYGRISPVYVNHCFMHHYYGPAFFAGECWYPHWNPWIAWSWGFHCHPIWDPRPIWCRPIIYEPYVAWVWWQPPVWQPLPETTVGTWVDVKPIVVEPQQYDLQLLAVRFVDPGHPEEKTGPRYRVWFRNNSRQPITQPFNVMLFASNDKLFGQDLPKAGVRVTAIDAGDTQSVDIRLPIEVYSMNRDAAGQPAPFEFLHFFVDANREIDDVTRANNGAIVPREEMLPVDPAAFETDQAQINIGGELIIAGEGFGPQPGQVLLHVGEKEVQAEVAGWYDLGAKIIVPNVEIAAPTEAELIVIRGDGAAANPLRITLLPEQAGPVLEMPIQQ